MKVDFFHRYQRSAQTTPIHTASRSTPTPSAQFTPRLKILTWLFYGLLTALLVRLSYWQIIKSSDLRAAATNQYQRKVVLQGQRGNVYTSDSFLLVSNEPVWHLFGQPHQTTQPANQIAQLLLPALTPAITRAWETASPSGTLTQEFKATKDELEAKLSRPNTKWVSLFRNLKSDEVSAIKQLNVRGLVFEPGFQRLYPEASMAAQVVGFVGQNQDGEETGYFGVEGALNKELQSQVELRTIESDALGGRLTADQPNGQPHGRDIVLTIRRDIQYLAESTLKSGMEKYGAAAGEVIIMEPRTGKILALAGYPNYDPAQYQHFDSRLYKNPSVSSLFEPGSTFKTLTVAAGIDAGVITDRTTCPRCDSARTIAGYTLKTWNDQYTPNISMTDALAKSDNTAMIFIAEELGVEKFKGYLKKFGIDAPSNIEMQEDTAARFPDKWGPVELATRSFGQGISTTSLQLLKAVNAIANGGKIMRPLIVEKVINPVSNEVITVQPLVESQAISPTTAKTVTQMMINAAAHGEAKWTASRTHQVAGKTGTAQVAIDGHYDSSKTIASFIGFAPADDPKFIMLVKLTEPTSSPWAAETAAPLWYQIAQKLYLILNIPPDFDPNAAKTPPESATSHSVTLD